jgi:D-sedoheptulose 7-phosphate isomerase
MKKLIEQRILESIQTKEALLKDHLDPIVNMAKIWISTLNSGGKIMFCGNGGSAADSQHIATELMVRLKHTSSRPALAALALTTDTSLITAGANDLGFEEIFARQVEGLGRKEDCLVAISTSGNSENVIRAVKKAKEIGMNVVAWLGNSGGKLKDMVDVAIVVPHDDSGRIQESHIMIGHILSELTENELYG